MSDPENDADQGSGTDGTPEAIDDDQLPEDLRPSEDNPLAQPLDPEDDATKDPEELDMQGGKPAEQPDEDGDGDGGGDEDTDRDGDRDEDRDEDPTDT